MDQEIKSRAESWLGNSFDEETRQQVQALIDADSEELTDAFYKDLEFGTGGLRGIMGPGTNRINTYTIGMATQGLANYVQIAFPGENIRVAIAHDSRNNSSVFALRTAEVFAANGFEVFLFESLRPTPELSFALRHLNCHSGVVITASHNPKEYNGYKVYWNDGGQLVAPYDKAVIGEVRKIQSVDEVKTDASAGTINLIGAEIDVEYINRVCGLSLQPADPDFKVVFTPIHGTGGMSVPPALTQLGYTGLHVLEAQAEPDGNFPTVHSPNPEEPAALELAINKAKELNADLVLGTDPDADRVGIAVRNTAGELVLLNGNQTGALLVDHLLRHWKNAGKLTGKEFIAKTVVTTELLQNMADHYGVACYETLTGFKYIAEVIKKKEGQEQFIGGGEESYGYLAGDFVRDKDAVISAVLITEAAATAKREGSSLYERLIELYLQFGLYRERLLSITKKGKAGAEAIQDMMAQFRENPPTTLDGEPIHTLADFAAGTMTELATGNTQPTGLPASNVIQFRLADGSRITARPSGTEPKIKFYFSLKGQLSDAGEFEAAEQQLDARIDRMISAMELS